MSISDIQEKKNVFETNPRITILFINISLIIIIFIIFELIIRIIKPPSFLHSQYDFIKFAENTLKNGQEISVSHAFLTDSEGVYKANKDYTSFTKDIKINSDGFRGIEFVPQNDNKIKILFLGDSFTWGGSAKPITNSFVDKISNTGYVCYNAGIPGVGLVQYAYLAEKYVPVLKPDYVSVILYLGNDINVKPDPMQPNKNLWHLLDEKFWLYAFTEEGDYLTPSEAIQYRLNKFYNVNPVFRLLRGIAIKTMIGTKVWESFSKLKNRIIQNMEYNDLKKNSGDLKDSVIMKNEYVINCLDRIYEICDSCSSKFVLFIIPEKPSQQRTQNSIDNNLCYLGKYNPCIPTFLSDDDYDSGPNAHFNNMGHYKYAQYILSEIEKSNVKY